ncbi:autotransporter domain protein [Campylobacter pinnipediorum subsp. caledonicus]|uniref:autotransporter outer membrane beta-barrel domain-containing protein n=1 Tax=Campylobacter pinnipediorum TaxID=1965231 RepID=UPI0009956D06|nr:autotransporter outer membrane beta-barrel domain-containing protein [Campylobacter pinnipediorum]AQW85273.1 autotransporter domain protein [Campylobacter pinnipediorum subsp. caledonicus]
MKISMIAYATLLGAIIATGAFAADDEHNTNKERHVYDTEKMRLEKAQKAEEVFKTELQNLKQYIDDLKKYSQEDHKTGNLPKIHELMQKIHDARAKIRGQIGEDIEYENGNKYIEYEDGKGNKVTLKYYGGVKIKINGKEKNFALDEKVNNKAGVEDYKTFFDDKNKEIILGLIDGFIKKFHEAVEVREDKVVEREKDYIGKLSIVDDYSKQDMDAINSISKDLIREIKETSDALGTNHEFNLGKNDSDVDVKITIKDAKHAKALSDAIDTLKTHNGKKIEEVRAAAKLLLGAGVKLKVGRDLSKITDIDQVKDALDIKDFNTVYNSKFDSDKKVKEAVQALTLRDQLLNFNEDSSMTSYFETQMDDKKEELKKALEEKKEEEEVKKAQQAFEEAEKTFYDSVSLRANTLIENPKNSLSSAAKDIISSMNDKNLLKNKIIHQNMVSLSKNSLVSFVKSNETSIQSATNEIGKVSNLDMVNFSNQLSTQTRLAKLSNPFNEDLALASAINKLSNDKFADNGDSVSSVIKSYTDRFNNDNNIWANVIGAKGKVKDSSNPELHGFSIGYDRAFDNTIVGGYMTLAKSKADSSLINTKASNYQFGLYGRTYIDNSEIDTRVSFGKAKNKLSRNVILNGKMLTQDGKYDTTYTSLAVDYGYVMNLSDSLFMKPLVGLDYSHSKSKAFKETGDLPLSFNGVTSKSLNAKLGLEFRKYVDNGNYLYITPGFEAEVYKDVKDPVARFIGSNKDIKLKADDKKGRFVTLKTGAELKLTDALSTNVNFGVKAKSKQQYFDGTVGLKYKF